MSKVIHEDDGNIVSSRIRIVHGDGVEVLLSNDDIGFISTLWRDEALALADAIIAEFRPKKKRVVKMIGDEWCVSIVRDVAKQIYGDDIEIVVAPNPPQPD